MRNFLLLSFSLLSLLSTPVFADNEVSAGDWTLTVDDGGKATLTRAGRVILSSNEAVWGLNGQKFSYSSLVDITTTSAPLSDETGTGVQLVVKGHTEGQPITEIIHTYYIYEDKDFIFTQFTATSDEDLTINYMAPVHAGAASNILNEGTNYALFVPFDNDMWVRYKTTPFGSSHPLSFNVSALFNAESRHGLVTGAIEHDVWKTGIAAETSGNTDLQSLTVYGGAVSYEITHDVLPHGAVVGKSVKSPMVMVGYFDDWRIGMETYADLCAAVAPRLACKFAKPFGWNSWGVIQDKINYDKACAVSDFFANELQPEGFVNADSVVFIGLDSFWDFGFSIRNHMSFVRRCNNAGQKAGIYWTPFTEWGKNPEAYVPGTNNQYKYADCYLYDNNGNVQEIDGGYALDPTHPATQARMAYQFGLFLDWGYEYVKIDFMSHGALEGKHYDPEVFTGIQAYSKGMQYLNELVGDRMFINLSIAPLFPANYAHSRRIGCDSYRSISETEYTLNSLTYGWWLDHVYSYNDADHIVLDGATYMENRSRVTSSVITGIFISGDDFSNDGPENAKNRARTFFTNRDVNEVARVTKAFKPVEAAEGEAAADMFVYNVADTLYLAAFNYTMQNRDCVLDFERLGLTPGVKYMFHELWTGDKDVCDDSWTVIVRRYDALLYKIYPYDDSRVAAVGNDATACYYDAFSDMLRFTGNVSVVDSTVYDVSGVCRLQMHGLHNSLDVATLGKGIYLYRGIDTAGSSITYKFIK